MAAFFMSRFFPEISNQKTGIGLFSQPLTLRHDIVIYLQRFPGCFLSGHGGEEAEIKPVEPDQGNACAGKDRASLLSFPVFVNPAEPVRWSG
jgi:hypothetical protein